MDFILQTLQPFKDQLNGIVVESTYNWYWLVDGLMDAGYDCVHLANPSAIKQYEGLKHSDDQHDAFFLVQLLILGILPQGYIYPKKDRPVRDLARKRMFLVKHKTAHLLSLQSFIARCCGQVSDFLQNSQISISAIISNIIRRSPYFVFYQIIEQFRVSIQRIKKSETIFFRKHFSNRDFIYTGFPVQPRGVLPLYQSKTSDDDLTSIERKTLRCQRK